MLNIRLFSLDYNRFSLADTFRETVKPQIQMGEELHKQPPPSHTNSLVEPVELGPSRQTSIMLPHRHICGLSLIKIHKLDGNSPTECH